MLVIGEDSNTLFSDKKFSNKLRSLKKLVKHSFVKPNSLLRQFNWNI